MRGLSTYMHINIPSTHKPFIISEDIDLDDFQFT